MILLTTKEASAQLRMGRKEFLQLGIPYIALGKRKRRYRQEDIDSFVNSHICYPRSTPTPETTRRVIKGLASVKLKNGHPVTLSIWEQAKALAKSKR